MNNYFSKYEEAFNQKLLRNKLIVISLYIAIYENFKSTIIDKVKSFYIDGISEGKLTYSEYEENVLNKISPKEKNRVVKATLLWLRDNGAIDDNDERKFIEITNLRNSFAHEMNEYFLDGLPNNTEHLQADMLNLFKKIMKWWINEVEIPISGDFLPGEYDSEQVESLIVRFCEAIADIALNENNEYLEALKQVVLGK